MSTQTFAAALAPYADELVAFRRDLHAHPELGRHEVRTTQRVAERLQRAGLCPELLPGTGVVCDIGRDTGLGRPVVALRADLDLRGLVRVGLRRHSPPSAGCVRTGEVADRHRCPTGSGSWPTC